MEIGSRQENASNQKSRAPFRFHRNGKGSRAPPVALGAMRTLMAGKAHRCGRKRPEANIRSEKSMADTQCETGSLLKHVIASICSDQPIQILRANKAVFMNKDAPKSPITPAKSHFARNPKPANVTNRGYETRLNRLIETKPAGPPLSVRYGSNRTAMANSVQLERSRDQPKTIRIMNNNVNQLACPQGFQSLSIIRVNGSSFSAAINLVASVVP